MFQLARLGRPFRDRHIDHPPEPLDIMRLHSSPCRCGACFASVSNSSSIPATRPGSSVPTKPCATRRPVQIHSLKLAGFLEPFSSPATTHNHLPSPALQDAREGRFLHQYAQTQQNVSASNFVQSDPARGFHETIWSDRMPNLAAMPSQESPHCT